MSFDAAIDAAGATELESETVTDDGFLEHLEGRLVEVETLAPSGAASR
jgi:hypothetical protein